MFAESMLETSWSQRSRRGWTTLTSFGVQALLMGVLLMVPLLRPEGLTLFHRLSTPVSLGRPMAEPTAMRNVAASSSGVAINNSLRHDVRLPAPIPHWTMNPNDDPGPSGPPGTYIPDGAGPGFPGGVANLFPSGTAVVPIAPPKPVVRQPPTSHMMEGNLIQRIQPTYPPIARNARIQGRVLLAAVISKEGTIENLRVLAGHPMLVNAAVEAVSRWHYRPYVLNGEPVEVETQITVNFSLTGN